MTMTTRNRVRQISNAQMAISPAHSGAAPPAPPGKHTNDSAIHGEGSSQPARGAIQAPDMPAPPAALDLQALLGSFNQMAETLEAMRRAFQISQENLPPPPSKRSARPEQQRMSSQKHRCEDSSRTRSDTDRRTRYRERPPRRDRRFVEYLRRPRQPDRARADSEGVGRKDRPAYIVNYRSPLTRDIQNSPLPHKFKMTSTCSYDGIGDPQDHLDNYVDLMSMSSVSDGGKCRCFGLTLKDRAKTWYRNLRPNSISSWRQLTQAFMSQFRTARRCTMPASHLANIQQGKDETLGSYLARFRRERIKVAATSDEAVKILAIGGVRSHTPFWRDLQAEECSSLDEFYEIAEKHLRIENAEKLIRISSPEHGRSSTR